MEKIVEYTKNGGVPFVGVILTFNYPSLLQQRYEEELEKEHPLPSYPPTVED